MPRGHRGGGLAAGIVFASLWVFAAPPQAHGHALLHEVTEGRAITVRFYFPDDDSPLFEPYQILAPGRAQPFQTGRVNTLGEVTFRPDRPGEWRVQVTTADGHGARVVITVDDTLTPSAAAATSGWMLRVLTGLGWLLGIFGSLALWRLYRASGSG